MSRPIMPSDSRPNRRRASRVAADLPIRLSARDSAGEAWLKDISTNGMCFTFPDSLPEMTVVRLNLEVEEGQEKKGIEVDGAVVRCEKMPPSPRLPEGGFEVAVFFTNLAKEHARTLHGYVTTRERELSNASYPTD